MENMNALETTLFISAYFLVIFFVAWFLIPWLAGTETMYSLIKWHFTHKRSKVEIIDSILEQQEKLNELIERKGALDKQQIELQEKRSRIDMHNDLFNTVHKN